MVTTHALRKPIFVAIDGEGGLFRKKQDNKGKSAHEACPHFPLARGWMFLPFSGQYRRCLDRPAGVVGGEISAGFCRSVVVGRCSVFFGRCGGWRWWAYCMRGSSGVMIETGGGGHTVFAAVRVP